MSAWFQFLAVSLAIVAAGYWLARYGDVIAEKTGLGGTWIGVIQLATITSLPELVTGPSSVTLANLPEIAFEPLVLSAQSEPNLLLNLDEREEGHANSHDHNSIRQRHGLGAKNGL